MGALLGLVFAGAAHAFIDQASPSSLDFGRVGLGEGEQARSVELLSVGTTSGLSCTISGSHASEFGAPGCNGRTLLDGWSSQDITFDPASPGTKSALLTIGWSGSGATVTVDLSAAVPALSVTPGSHVFGDTALGSSGDQDFTFTNDHSATVTITSIVETAAGTGCDQFGSTPTPPIAIGAGGSSTVTISFAPMVAGLHACSFVVTDDTTPGLAWTIQVEGEGLAPDIALSPASPFSFGSLDVGGTASQIVTIANQGDAPLVVDGITKASASGCSHFVLIDAATPREIASGGSDEFSVQFAPTAGGEHACTITLTSNDPGEGSASYVVSGTGVAVAVPGLSGWGWILCIAGLIGLGVRLARGGVGSRGSRAISVLLVPTPRA